MKVCGDWGNFELFSSSSSSRYLRLGRGEERGGEERSGGCYAGE